ncbi:hypothetical protein Nos7524_1892 [Nostoc sp. PCC 7524]|uniref:DUF433 domain-containing protein n=1 Tax=Nostoc sp. (strain ATCC 29411 / PCC 7524) TaxID=28072 RepID=UPI00029F1BA8|nr:DUF433 domain-containing protein [Nostoc sp. PCC 7524]AFY47751.1 hypothetical protein Nos7524_1892 [Nostoc sp. PCC 7524]
MTAYALNLPEQLKHEIEQLAQSQGISLDQFILWAVTEKVSTLKGSFPQIAYRQGANGQLIPVIKGTGMRVQTVAIASQKWGMSPSQIANEYELTETEIKEALSFYAVNQEQIDAAIACEQSLEIANG